MTAPVSPVSDDVPTDESATPAVPAYVAPDRADAPVSEVTERFLRAIIAQVPVDRIEELHLFSPLRQGTVETGIAVLATRVEVPVEAAEPVVDETEPLSEDAPELLLGGDAMVIDAEVDATIDATVDVSIDADVDADVDATVDAAIDAEVEAMTDATVDLEAEGEAADAEAEAVADAEVEFEDEGLGDDEITIADPSGVVHAEAIIADEGADDEALEPAINGSESLIPINGSESLNPINGSESLISINGSESLISVEAALAPEEIPDAPRVRAVRHTVYTARYRYVIKGPERGKWEASVKAEAEAPLITVETVVRGVQRRAGEETEIVRYSGAQIARALRIPTA